MDRGSTDLSLIPLTNPPQTDLPGTNCLQGVARNHQPNGGEARKTHLQVRVGILTKRYSYAKQIS